MPPVAVAGILAFASPAAATELPSGVDAQLQEVLIERIGGETWARFRLVAAGIDRAIEDAPGFRELEGDFPHLCAKLAIPYLESHAIDADRIVISIADRAVEFGISDPDATQYFELFRIDAGTCFWEAF